jgi:hypothetical protein
MATVDDATEVPSVASGRKEEAAPAETVRAAAAAAATAQPTATVSALPRIRNHLIDRSELWNAFDIQVRTTQPDRCMLAIDAEWHNDRLCLVQIAFMGPQERAPRDATTIHVYTIDCVLLPQQEVRVRLHPVLSNVRLRKLAFDCREDCRMLQEQLGLNIPVGLFDLQLLEIVTREDAGPRSLYNVRGLKAMLLEFPSLARFVEAKSAQDLTALGSSSVFLQRPLPPAVLDYASCDVASLFTLYEELQTRPRYKQAPGRVTDQVIRATIEYSRLSTVVPPEFRRHNMLPLGVLDMARAQGTRTCQGCFRPVAQRDREYCKVCNAHLRRDVTPQQAAYIPPPTQGTTGDIEGHGSSPQPTS